MKRLLLVLTLLASLLPAQGRRAERAGGRDGRPQTERREGLPRLEQRLEALRERLQQLRELRRGGDTNERMRRPAPGDRQGDRRGQRARQDHPRLREHRRSRMAEAMRQHRDAPRGQRPGDGPRRGRRSDGARQEDRRGTQPMPPQHERRGFRRQPGQRGEWRAPAGRRGEGPRRGAGEGSRRPEQGAPRREPRQQGDPGEPAPV